MARSTNLGKEMLHKENQISRVVYIEALLHFCMFIGAGTCIFFVEKLIKMWKGIIGTGVI